MIQIISKSLNFNLFNKRQQKQLDNKVKDFFLNKQGFSVFLLSAADAGMSLLFCRRVCFVAEQRADEVVAAHAAEFADEGLALLGFVPEEELALG
ncbi:MAG: hypothetical protein Q4E32_02420 [Bacteroidales bacterium]|nr:hypothetical protein [Bacteroidales bacterium]